MPYFRRFLPPASSTTGRVPVQPPVFPLVALIALALSAATAVAQPLTDALAASDPSIPGAMPSAPSAPPAVAPDLPQPRGDIEQARALWRRVNQRVAEFPRGHIDLLRWEAHQPEPPTVTTPPVGPALDWQQVQRESLRHRPDLFVHAGMNGPASSAVQRAYAEHMRELRRAWVDAIAAAQTLPLQETAWQATATGVALGRRMVEAGNWSLARLLDEQLVETRYRQAFAQATQSRQAAVERLARLMGLWRAEAVSQLGARLPAELPAPPDRLTTGLAPDEDPEAAALSASPALTLQSLHAERTLMAVRTGQLDAWAKAIDLALQRLPDAPGTRWQAPQISDRRLLNDETLEAAVEAQSELLRAAAERRSLAREAWAQLQAQHVAARQQQDVVVQLQTVRQQETVLRYNGMLQSSWDLLAAARERLNALADAVQARRSYWLAQADWDALLAGAGYDSPSAEPSPGGRSNRSATNSAAAGGH